MEDTKRVLPLWYALVWLLGMIGLIALEIIAWPHLISSQASANTTGNVLGIDVFAVLFWGVPVFVWDKRKGYGPLLRWGSLVVALVIVGLIAFVNLRALWA